LTGLRVEKKRLSYLQQIEVLDPERDKIWGLLTNRMDSGASTIAAIYQERWQIEIFFKALS